MAGFALFSFGGASNDHNKRSNENNENTSIEIIMIFNSRLTITVLVLTLLANLCPSSSNLRGKQSSNESTGYDNALFNQTKKDYEHYPSTSRRLKPKKSNKGTKTTTKAAKVAKQGKKKPKDRRGKKDKKDEAKEAGFVTWVGEETLVAYEGTMVSYKYALLAFQHRVDETEREMIVEEFKGTILSYFSLLGIVMVEFPTGSVEGLLTTLDDIRSEYGVSEMTPDAPIRALAPYHAMSEYTCPSPQLIGSLGLTDNERILRITPYQLGKDQANIYKNGPEDARSSEALHFIKDLIPDTATRSVRIAVIDTGFNPSIFGDDFPEEESCIESIDAGIPEGQERWQIRLPLPRRNTLPGFSASSKSMTDEPEYHGTMVTNVIAGAINGRGTNGAAKLLNGGAPILVRNYKMGEGLQGMLLALEDIFFRDDTDIVNLSFGSHVSWEGPGEFVVIGDHPEILFVAAAGNDNLDMNSMEKRILPVGFSSEYNNVIGVSGHSICSQRIATGSNYDSRIDNPRIQISAPMDFLFLNRTGLFETWGGTSFSAPLVASAAALVMAINDNYGPAEVRDLLVSCGNTMENTAGGTFDRDYNERTGVVAKPNPYPGLDILGAVRNAVACRDLTSTYGQDPRIPGRCAPLSSCDLAGGSCVPFCPNGYGPLVGESGCELGMPCCAVLPEVCFSQDGLLLGGCALHEGDCGENQIGVISEECNAFGSTAKCCVESPPCFSHNSNISLLLEGKCSLQEMSCVGAQVGVVPEDDGNPLFDCNSLGPTAKCCVDRPTCSSADGLLTGECALHEMDCGDGQVGLVSEYCEIAFGAADARCCVQEDSSQILQGWNTVAPELVGETIADHFGTSLALSGDGLILAVGATDSACYCEETCGNPLFPLWLVPGYVRVFHRGDSQNAEWQPMGSPIYGNDTGESYFASKLSISQDGFTLALRRSDSVQVYRYDGTDWIPFGGPIEAWTFNEYRQNMLLSGDGRTLLRIENYDVLHIYSYSPVLHDWELIGTIDTKDRITSGLSSVDLSFDGSTVAFSHGQYCIGDDCRYRGPVKVLRRNLETGEWKKHGTSNPLGYDFDEASYSGTFVESVKLSQDGMAIAVAACYETNGYFQVYEYHDASGEWRLLGNADWAFDNPYIRCVHDAIQGLSDDRRTAVIRLPDPNIENQLDTKHIQVLQFENGEWVEAGKLEGFDYFSMTFHLAVSTNNGVAVAMGVPYSGDPSHCFFYPEDPDPDPGKVQVYQLA